MENLTFSKLWRLFRKEHSNVDDSDLAQVYKMTVGWLGRNPKQTVRSTWNYMNGALISQISPY